MSTTYRRPAVLAGLLVLAAGCARPDVPQTYPVTGTVAFDDGQPVPGGKVHFQSTVDETLTINGDIQEDGTFTLSTLKGKSKVAGAPEGSYTVTVQGPIVEHRMLFPLVTLPASCQVEPKENHFDLKVERPADAPQRPITPGAP
jgi:hypothetical protein